MFSLIVPILYVNETQLLTLALHCAQPHRTRLPHVPVFTTTEIKTPLVHNVRSTLLFLRLSESAMAQQDLGKALAKKGGLTLAQLASYDDVLTDALVDRVSIPIHLKQLRREEKRIYLIFPMANTGILLGDHPQEPHALLPFARHPRRRNRIHPPFRRHRRKGRQRSHRRHPRACRHQEIPRPSENTR